MRSRLQADLSTAIAARDRFTVAVLRSALAAIDNAGAQPLDAIDQQPGVGVGATDVERRALDDSDVEAMIQREIDEAESAANQFDQLTRADHAADLCARAELLRRYLPNERR